MCCEPLDPTAIAAGLSLRATPPTIHCHATVSSTMDLARTLLNTLAPHHVPALVVADAQTAGRGRMGRPWVAPAGTALLFSLAFRPTWLPPEQGVALVWLAAVALCEAVEAVTPLHPGLKWPNDLLVAPARSTYAETTHPTQAAQPPPSPALADGDSWAAPHELPWAKAAGLLLEMTLGAAGIEGAILGCGVNVSAAPPVEITRYPATSLAAAAGVPVSRLALLRALLLRLDAWQQRLQAGERSALFTAWRTRLVTLGRQVSVVTPHGLIAGLAVAVDHHGGLLVRDPNGVLHTITTGDVGLVPV